MRRALWTAAAVAALILLGRAVAARVLLRYAGTVVRQERQQ
jgi:hypothetical protein